MKNYGLQLLLKMTKYLALGFIVQLMLFSLVLASESTAQTKSVKEVFVELGFDNTKLKDVFSSIEEVTDFRFTVYENESYLHQTFTLDRQQISVEQLLYRISEQSGLAFQQINNNIGIKKGSRFDFKREQRVEIIIQTRTVTGKVTSREDGDGLPGVNVIEKGTSNGTVTDVQGDYSLIVSDGAVLVFSSVGFLSEEIEVGNRSNVDLEMTVDVQTLDEIVVVGYGAVKKSDLTGSITHVNVSENMQQLPNVSIIESLQGAVPGLNVGVVTSPGSSPNFSVRGLNTFSSSDEQPLVVLDGVIYRGSLIDLNPNDIETITVLKDASSTAIYGAQASNGVILIESRKGKTGKPTIRYSGHHMIGFPGQNTIVPMKAAENEQFILDALWEQSRLGPDYLQPNPDFYLPDRWDRPYLGPAYLKWKETGEEYNWYEPFSRNAQNNRHNISLSGRNEGLGYFFSTGVDDSKGYLLNDDYKRYNFRINLDAKVTDWFNLGIESFYTMSDNSGAVPSFEQMVITQPWVFPYDENGELNPVDPSARAAVGNHIVIQEDDERKRHNLFGKMSGEFILLEGLKYRINASYNQRVNFSNHFYPMDYNIAYQSRAYKNTDFSSVSSLDNIVSFQRTFNNIHAVDVTLLYGVEEFNSSFTEAEGIDFINPSLGYHALEVGDPSRREIDSGAEKESSIYSMARIFYKLNNKYLLTGTVRRDGFSGFGLNNKFGIFPSVAVGWVASEESFFNVSMIDFLKLRSSYGSSGRRGLGRYDTRAVVREGFDYVFGDGGSSELGKYINSLANNDLKWETTTGLNVGVDFGIMDSRIRGNIDYYRNNTKDILYPIQIPQMTGFSSINTNIGKVRNHGLEFSITGDIVRSSDLNWETTVNFSRDRNYIESILGFDNDGDGKEDDLVANELFIGEPQGVIYGYEILGQGEMWQLSDQQEGVIPTGFYPGTYKIVDQNEDEIFSASDDRVILGYTAPSFRFGIANTLTYKNFSLYFFINSIQGGKNYYYGHAGPINDWNHSSLIPLRNAPAGSWDYWMPENPNAKYRRLDLAPTYQGRVYDQRNFIRLQDATFAYNLDNRNSGLLNDLSISRLKVFLSGKNLLLITKWEGWDPETGRGYDYGLPVMTNLSLGLNVEF